MALESVNWQDGIIGAGIGALSAIGVALVNGRSSLNATIDARIKTILQDDEKTITRLESELKGLRRYVNTLITIMLKAGIEVPPDPSHVPDPLDDGIDA
jgi:hypothetical protein